MIRNFVMGDIHGAYRALRQCLQHSDFNYLNDHLICLGDVADGWPETKACIEELLKVKNLTYLLGNHDFWTLEWMETGFIEEIWFEQGGKATIDSYGKDIPERHIQFLKRALSYYLLNNKLFVHAGIDLHIPIEAQTIQTFIWDRNLATMALNFYARGISEKLSGFDEIFIGHTPVPSGKPLKACEVWLMDTGAGWSGNLSMMNIDTHEIFTSDPVPSLYPGVQGRKRR